MSSWDIDNSGQLGPHTPKGQTTWKPLPEMCMQSTGPPAVLSEVVFVHTCPGSATSFADPIHLCTQFNCCACMDRMRSRTIEKAHYSCLQPVLTEVVSVSLLRHSIMISADGSHVHPRQPQTRGRSSGYIWTFFHIPEHFRRYYVSAGEEERAPDREPILNKHRSVDSHREVASARHGTLFLAPCEQPVSTCQSQFTHAALMRRLSSVADDSVTPQVTGDNMLRMGVAHCHCSMEN